MKHKKTADFSRRVAAAFTALMLAFGVIPARMMTILLDASQSAASGTAGGKVIAVGQSRGLIYDRNGNRLTGCETKGYAAVKPTAGAVAVLKDRLNEQEFEQANRILSKGLPLLLCTEKALVHDDILLLRAVERTVSNELACHLIGYTDETGSGVCGLEKSLNESLDRYRGELKVRFRCDAMGRVMADSDIEVLDERYDSAGGVVLTLDKPFQQAVENAMDACGLKTGAAVILDCSDGGVCAMASRPRFDPMNVAESMDQANSPLFDRALAAYPVGSVFKLLIAAAALEQGVDPAWEWPCGGAVTVGGKPFRCLKAHGTVNMPQALAYSCNCYFIQLMQQLDVESVLTLAESFGFGQSFELSANLSSASGTLPDAQALASAAARANFSFGQGSLTAAILQIASLYAAVFAGGDYYEPYLIRGEVDETGDYTETHETPPPYKLLKPENARMLSEFLGVAVREGTGQAAAVEDADCRGKTATAQSGDFSSGKERLVSWFAGGFTCEGRQYAMVVLCDDGVSGSIDCAPVFAGTVRRIFAAAEK